MNVEESLLTVLLNDSVLQSNLLNRIYYVTLPENVKYPAMTVQKISTVRDQAFIHNPGTVDSRFQLTLFTTDYPQIKTITERINSTEILLDFTGLLGGSCGTQVDFTEFLNETELTLDPDYDIFGVALDWGLYYHE